MNRLLLVDDDNEVLSLNKKFFEAKEFEVKTASSAKEAFNILKSFKPDCILLDVMMEGTDGFEACSYIKETFGNIPIIFLTGRISEDDKINGLMLGADDYIEKPYSLNEVHARVIVQLRKKSMNAPAKTNILSVPPIEIDLLAHKAFFNGQEIVLANREYELLVLLAENKNKIVTFEDIGKKLYGIYTDNDRRTIMVTASRMRKKIEDYTGLDNLIETAYAKGYCLRSK